MKAFKNIVLILSVFLYSHVVYSQNQTLLFVEDFEDASSLLLNFPLSGHPNNGNNQWIRNNIYDGLGLYPNTPPQDSTYGSIGQIGTPNGYYIHIKNTSVPVFNANYDPLNVSNRAAVLNNGVCTYGYNKVTLVFWWLAKGSPGDYGEVYYSIDGGGSWNLTTNIDGYSKYYNMDRWKYTEIELSVFLNQDDLRFAFKWTNDGINTSDVLPFSIDDILIVGEFDPDNPLIDIIANYILPNPVCQEDVVNTILDIYFTTTSALCPGNYEIEVSDSNCNFNNSFIVDNFSLAFLPQGSWFISRPLLVPTFLPIASCYCFRMNRTSAPNIIGIADTGCFEIIDCPESIEVLDPPPAVLQDPYYNPSNPANPPGLPAGQQPICLYSVIDVKFFTYGAYNPGNNYILELSDSSGSFADPTTIGGPMPSTQTHDPAIYPMQSPGSISGTIPDSVNGERLPNGCNYYLRVVSTDPVVDSLSTPWGPFCIMACDIKTNNGESISVCITDGCNATVSKTIAIGTTDLVDFSYNVSISINVIDINSIDSMFFDNISCTYIDTTIIDSIVEYVYTIAITGSGPFGSGWSWYVNDELQSPGDSMNPSFSYTCPGTYTVSLVASDSCINHVVKDVQIGVLSAGFSHQVDSTIVNFTDSSSYSPGDSISWAWDFGDGWMSDEQNPVHEYNSCYGSYTVTLTITQNCCSTSYTEEVLAGDLVADFEYSVSGNTVIFSDNSSSDSSCCSDDIATWIWDYGDGNTDIFGTVKDTYIIPDPCGIDSIQNILRTSGDTVHTFSTCGFYDVKLTIIDSGGVCIDIPIGINTFDSTIFYDPCNQFMVQILSPGDPPAYPPAMTIISTGDLGMMVSSNSDTLTLCIPRFSDYLADGYQLGTYYLRIIATSSNDTIPPFDTTNLFGSIIRLSVTGVSASVIDFDIIDQFGNPLDTICATLEFICLQLNSPLVNTSNYFVQFLSGNQIFATFLWNPDIHPWPNVCLFADIFPTGTYNVTIQEVEKGFAPFETTDYCVGPLSGPKQFTINGPPDVNIAGSTTVCVGDTVTYSSLFKIEQKVCIGDSLTEYVQYLPATYYDWDFIDIFNIGSIITLANNQITIAWNSFGSASIGLTALGKCGSNYGTTTITVAPGSDLKTTPDTTVCEGEPFPLIAQNLAWVAYNTFSWIIDCDTIRDTIYEPGNIDTLFVTPDTGFTVIVIVDNGCPDRDTITVYVVNLPKLESDDAEICPGDTTLLNAVTSGAIEYVWYKLPNTSDTIGTDSSISVSPVVTTDYTVTVTYDSICSPKSETLTVTVNTPVVDAGEDKEIFRGDEVVLNASGGVTYIWVPAYGLNCTDCPTPTASPDTTTTYIVTITDIYGCIDYDTITVKVILLEVPDAFTPDGDGINDILYVYNLLGSRVGVKGDALESLDFKIFNRWGEVIFETTDINVGWEGKHMKTGRNMEIGVYVWLLTATTADGEDIGPISGNVSLIR